MKGTILLFLVPALLFPAVGTVFAGRYYDARIARWTTPDPLSRKQMGWTPYHYSYNNPIRFVDPSGLIPGEYRDEKGNKIGDDGVNDKKVYVTDQKTINLNTKDGKTDWQAVKSEKGTAQLPSAGTRAAIGKSIQLATANNEIGGIIATTSDGSEKVVDAKPGAPADPSKDKEVAVDPWNAQDPSAWANVTGAVGSFHTHPSATVTSGNLSFSFFQPPSQQDINVAKSNSAVFTGNSYVLGMRSGTTYIYNGGGLVRTFPTSLFVNP
jgi:uncharacterized protein RhaS with RHS repeats